MEGPGALIFFMRSPAPGKVKTRLAAGIGDRAAFGLYACFVQDMLKTLEGAGMDLHVFSWPARECGRVMAWLGRDLPVYPQAGADLGAKMKNAFEQVFAQGYATALLVGSDIPDLPAWVVAEAVQALENCDCALGPSHDGGYYLVGFRREGFCPAVFSGPEWGTARVLQQTRDILDANRISHARVSPWRDVDDLDDLKALHARLQDGKAPADLTRARLKKILAQSPHLLAQDKT